MSPCCEKDKSIVAHGNFGRTDVCPSTNRVSLAHILSPWIRSIDMGGSSTAPSMRIFPTSLLLLLLLPVGLAGQTTSNYSYLPQVSLTIRDGITGGLTFENKSQNVLSDILPPRKSQTSSLPMILTITLQPSARRVLTACSQHSLVASMASVASMMVNVNVHRDGLESIA